MTSDEERVIVNTMLSGEQDETVSIHAAVKYCFREGRQIDRQIVYGCFALLTLKKPLFLTSCVFRFVFLNASSHLCFRYLFWSDCEDSARRVSLTRETVRGE